MHLNTHPAEKQHCVIGKRTDSAKWMWTSERESYQHATFANTLAITCYLDALWNICSYEPVTPTLTFFFFFLNFLSIARVLCFKGFGVRSRLQLCRQFWFQQDSPGRKVLTLRRTWSPSCLFSASGSSLGCLRSAAQLPHSCCRAESLHQLWASGWRCCMHNIFNSSIWTLGASLLISFV